MSSPPHAKKPKQSTLDSWIKKDNPVSNQDNTAQGNIWQSVAVVWNLT